VLLSRAKRLSPAPVFFLRLIHRSSLQARDYLLAADIVRIGLSTFSHTHCAPQIATCIG